MKTSCTPLALTCFNLAFSIVLGALAAHVLKDVLSPARLESFRTAVQYHSFHALALLVLYAAPFFNDLPGIRNVRTYLQAGILFFSGSIYLLSTIPETSPEIFRRILGPLTPVGGVLFVLGWVVLGVRVLLNKNKLPA